MSALLSDHLIYRYILKFFLKLEVRKAQLTHCINHFDHMRKITRAKNYYTIKASGEKEAVERFDISSSDKKRCREV